MQAVRLVWIQTITWRKICIFICVLPPGSQCVKASSLTSTHHNHRLSSPHSSGSVDQTDFWLTGVFVLRVLNHSLLNLLAVTWAFLPSLYCGILSTAGRSRREKVAGFHLFSFCLVSDSSKRHPRTTRLQAEARVHLLLPALAENKPAPAWLLFYCFTTLESCPDLSVWNSLIICWLFLIYRRRL